MLILEVYFDETGHGDNPNIQLFGMVGCLAKAERWVDFEVEWNDVLKAEGLDYFHVKCLKGSWNGEFLSHTHGQPDLPHDDIMDSAAGAFNCTLNEGAQGFGF